MLHSTFRRVIAVAACALLTLVPQGEAAIPEVPAGRTIRHVFIIVLENQNFEQTFSATSPAQYLAVDLTRKGAFLRNYYGIGHASLDNYIAMISGIAPTPATQGDCERYSDFVQTGTAPDGQPIGNGCVYPAQVQTLANQLTSRGFTWKAYMEDMGKDPSREPATCAHPAIGAPDLTERATAGDQYAAKHNPFVYFHSIIDSPACDSNVVALPALERDLRSVATTPNLVFISPNLCHDGHDRPCRNGEPGGLTSANEFLKHWVPLILQSPAFRRDGLLMVTFDEAQSADASACCNEPTGPNTTAPGTHGPGGGRTGTVLLSPFIAPETVSDVPYNHYSMLRSIEDMFGLPYLGYAGQPDLVSFGRDIFSR